MYGGNIPQITEFETVANSLPRSLRKAHKWLISNLFLSIYRIFGKNPNINLENEHDFTIEISFNGYSPIDIKINGWDIKESDEM